MSARAPVGASNRADLFTSRTQNNDLVQQEKYSGVPEENQYETNNPLQLEHMLGYSGDYKKTVVASQVDDNIYYKGMGCLVSVENLNDPHGQRFLRGHDMPVSVIAVSPFGTLVASSQVGTKHFKGYSSPVFIWRSDSLARVAVLRGLTVQANLLAFSPDEKFLCGCDEDQQLCIWDLSTTEVIFSQKLLSVASVFKWVDQKKVGHYNAYEAVVAVGSVLQQGLFTYDPMRVQWSLKLNAYHMPTSGGIKRSFNCVDISADKTFVYVGTSAGEMMIYRRDTCVFRGVIPVCTNGLQDVVTLTDDTVVGCGGDGTLFRLSGKDMVWQKIKESKADSMVKSLSLSCNRSEIIVSCVSGAVLRCLSETLSYTVAALSHTTGVSCISFSKADGNSAVHFVTGTISGEIRLWDLTDYACLSVTKFPKSGAVLCLSLIDQENILSGWHDGSIRCTDSAGRVKWFLPTAHRDGTNTISHHMDSSLQYIVSGGGDGAVRVWKMSNRELVTQYTEHRRGVAKVIVDVRSPNIVHSVGGDCSVLSYDLKAAKRIICHIANTGTMVSLTQRRDSELELITGDSLGQLLYWDIDVRDPVMAVQDPSRATIRCCEISKSGRFLAFCGDDHTLKVLDVQSNAVLAVGKCHSDKVKVIAWTPDERQVVSGGDDSCLCVWNFFLGGADT